MIKTGLSVPASAIRTDASATISGIDDGLWWECNRSNVDQDDLNPFANAGNHA